MKFTALYAALLAIIFVILTVRTIRARRITKIADGSGDNMQMLRAIGAHSNFAEYTPFALLLIFLVESNGAPSRFIHFLGCGLVLGRILQGFGLSQKVENFKFRITGMALTFAIYIFSAVYLIWNFLTSHAV